MNYIEIPNLPKKCVKVVLISSDVDKEVLESLENMGIEAIVVSPCSNIAKPVASHPDMLFHHLGGKHMVFYSGVDEAVCVKLANYGFILTKSNSLLKQQYPRDILFNASRIGDYLFCNERYTDKSILSYCKSNHIHIISVKQGYTKCSTCVVDDNSIITSDKSIEKAAKLCKINVLLIRAGFIDLPGYNSGFIGGCCGKFSNDKMYFYGDITAHPDYYKIKSFLNIRNIEINMLCDNKLRDIGSIIPLIESD